MLRFAGILALASTVCLLLGTALEGGAKDGKIRWTAKRTGECSWFPAIVVPAKVDGGKWETKIVFKAKHLAEFFVIGDGDTDLDLYVLDSQGKEIAKDEAGSDLCVCRWTPDAEQEYTIRIVNRGMVYNVAQAGCN